MAAKTKTRAKRNSRARKTTARTMNQFANTARAKARTLRREAESVTDDAGAWVGEQAASVRDAIKAQPFLAAAIAAAVGLVGWLVGRRTL